MAPLLWFFGLVCFSMSVRCAGSQPAGVPAPEWDSRFERQTGWIGADGKTASKQSLEVHPVQAPSLRPDTAKLVLVP